MTIRELRNIMGLSQSEFGKHFNISVNTIRSWEHEDRKPPKYVTDMIEKLLKYEGYIKDEDNK